TLSGVKCNGAARPARQPVSVTISAGSGAVCTFTNRLDRPGRIEGRGGTIGGLGTAAYVTSPLLNPAGQRRQLARSTRQDVPFPAKGQSTDQLPFGSYVMQPRAGA